MSNVQLLRIFATVGLLTLCCCANDKVFAQNTSTSIEAAKDLEAHDPKRLRLVELAKSGDYNVRKVPIKGPKDIDTIASTNVVVQVTEPDYLIVVGTKRELQKIAELGFELLDAPMRDRKQRYIKVKVTTDKEKQYVADHISDIWQIADGVAVGRAFDYQIDWLRKQGFTVKVGKWPKDK